MSTKQVSGRLIQPENIKGQVWISKPFKLKALEEIPIEVPDRDAIYIITCWDTNTYIKMVDKYKFEIIETLGKPLRFNEEYLLIKPKY